MTIEAHPGILQMKNQKYEPGYELKISLSCKNIFLLIKQNISLLLFGVDLMSIYNISLKLLQAISNFIPVVTVLKRE